MGNVARLGAMQGVILIILLALASRCLSDPIKFYEFNITEKSITRLCSTKKIILVNNQFPGPTLDVNEGDRIVVKVNNFVSQNITLHWHGLFQNRTGWFDGPSHVTQCPIQAGKSFTYKINFTGQRGTLWWHAHIKFLRATVYGAMIIHPYRRFPFVNRGELPPEEHTIILGEWWKSDILDVINQAEFTGGGTNISDAFTINGLPGPLYGNCSVRDTHVWNVQPGKRYLLRIISATMNQELFFGIANHTLTVVEADAQYTKPLVTPSVVISPGQTFTVLLTTDQPKGSYFMAARAFDSTPPGFPFDNTTTAAVLNYYSPEEHSPVYPLSNLISNPPPLPALPAFEDGAFVADFTNKLRSLKRVRNEVPVPKTVDENLFITVGLNLQNCPPGKNPNISCVIPIPGGARFGASMNNISYVEPGKAFLKQHYDFTHFGVQPVGYTVDFPKQPRFFNFTSNPPIQNQNAPFGTKARVIKYGSNVEVVLQGTTLFAPENHPIHLHGFDFYVLAIGQGNFNRTRDEPKFNLVDPALKNTISVPAAGWAVIRFKADNPGTWIIHCHLDLHSLLGLDTVFIVEDGVGPLQSLEPPPADLPPC